MKIKNLKLSKVIMVTGAEKTNVCFVYNQVKLTEKFQHWYTITPKQAYRLVKRYNELSPYEPVETTIKANNTLLIEWLFRHD